MSAKILTCALSLLLVACGGGESSPVTTVPATASVPVVIPTASYSPGSVELGGWTVLQQARVLCGFGALQQNTKLDAAALAHARYLTSVSMATDTSLLSHYETQTSNPYYTGYYPWDRTRQQGYGTQVAEILEAMVWNYDIGNPPVFPSLEQRGASSMRSLLNTVYHLTGALYDGADVGFGTDIQTAFSGSARREEYRFGALIGFQDSTRRLLLGTGNLATYPCEGSSNIPSTFIPANETPNPFPAMTLQSQTVGPPIYLKVDAPQVLLLTASSISTGGLEVPTTVLTKTNDPQAELGVNEVFVMPLNPLQANTRYQVNLSGSIDGIAFSRSFTLTTGQ